MPFVRLHWNRLGQDHVPIRGDAGRDTKLALVAQNVQVVPCGEPCNSWPLVRRWAVVVSEPSGDVRPSRASATSLHTASRRRSAPRRLLRIDLGCKIDEKDLDGGYVLFDYVSPESGKQVHHGAIEFVRQKYGTHVAVQLSTLPRYHEQMVVDALAGSSLGSTAIVAASAGPALRLLRPTRGQTPTRSGPLRSVALASPDVDRVGHRVPVRASDGH